MPGRFDDSLIGILCLVLLAFAVWAVLSLMQKRRQKREREIRPEHEMDFDRDVYVNPAKRK